MEGGEKKNIELASGILAAVLLIGVITFSHFLGVPQEETPAVTPRYVSLTSSGESFKDVAEIAPPLSRRFEEEMNGYIASRESFIEIDLSKMEVYLFKEGELYKTLPVKSKGKEGSWWETPTGNYKIMSKEESHFSSIGRVWMPWSMQFYGNFFIHGWPYYEDGTQVSSSYSGGCVRLSTEDAEQVFEFATKDMPVLVRESEEAKDLAKISLLNPHLPAPRVSARAYHVFDLSSGAPILSKNSTQVLPIASLTKIMTGVVASELLYLGRPIEVRESMLASALASFKPEAGEEYVAFDLLYPLLMQSSNEAANILADFIGRRHFVNNMNRKAASLSMSKTNFADPAGLLEDNTSSARDMEKLLQYAYFKRKFILSIAKGKQDYRFEGRKLDNLENFNQPIEEGSLVGLKNGEATAEGETLAGVWEYDTAEGKAAIGVIVLGSKDTTIDTEALLEWVKQNLAIK